MVKDMVVVFGWAPVVVTLAEGGDQVIADRVGRGAESEAVVIGGGRARYHRSASGDDGCIRGVITLCAFTTERRYIRRAGR
jgi:hypothetical protein